MCSVTDTFFDANRRIWSGPKAKAFYGAEMTIGDVAFYNLNKNPSKVIQVMDPTGEKLTARELLKQSKSVALNFLRMGLEPGDIVGVSASNTSHLTAVVLASFFCGTPVNAIYPEFDLETVKLIYGVSQPKIIFCDVENYNVTKQANEDLDLCAEIFILNGNIEGVANVTQLLTLAEDEYFVNRKFPCSKLSGDSTAFILCSSGTTGPPKGVICSHTVLLNHDLYHNLRTDSVVFVFSTLYWISGIWTIVASLKNGIKRIITNKPFTPEYFVELIETHKITHTLTSPASIIQVNALYDIEIRDRLNSLDTVICGGAKVSDIVSNKFNKILGNKPRLGLTVAYGMSEISGALSADDGGPGKRRMGTEGKLYPNTEVRIVDKNGKNLGIGEYGTLFIRTPYKWAGYYKNAEATEKVYKNRWLNSGDIGYFDEDGYLHICSRDSDVFKSYNFQIYPQNIEKVISELPGVLEVCVFGLPDFMATNLIACAIVLTSDEQGQALTKADIELYVKSKLSDLYHLRGGVYFVESLPRTGSDKIMRRKVLDFIKKAK